MKQLRASASALALVLLALPAAVHARVVEKIAALVGDDLILQSGAEETPDLQNVLVRSWDEDFEQTHLVADDTLILLCQITPSS